MIRQGFGIFLSKDALRRGGFMSPWSSLRVVELGTKRKQVLIQKSLTHDDRKSELARSFVCLQAMLLSRKSNKELQRQYIITQMEVTR